MKMLDRILNQAYNGPLLNELNTLLSEINAQIETIARDALAMGCTRYEVRDSRGNYLITDLLVAKAKTLDAMLTMSRPFRRQ